MSREHVLRRALAIERDLGGHGAVGLDALERQCHHLPGPLHGIHSRGRLEAAVDHAVGTLLVIAGSVPVPVGALHELLEGFGVAFTEKIAGPLPTEYGARRVAPRRAPVGLIAG